MSKRILIAEDEPNIVTSLEFLLGKAGYETTVARDGNEALALAQRLIPDLIVLDIMLPAVDGFEVCRRLRAGPVLKDIRILMLTARGRDTEIAKGRGAGADCYMTKPFSTKELVGNVERLIGAPGTGT